MPIADTFNRDRKKNDADNMRVDPLYFERLVKSISRSLNRRWISLAAKIGPGLAAMECPQCAGSGVGEVKGNQEHILTSLTLCEKCVGYGVLQSDGTPINR